MANAKVETVDATPDSVLIVGEKKIVLPRTSASVGNDGLSVSRLLADGDVVSLDPGFTNTASCQSAITYIDGGAGILRYRLPDRTIGKALVVPRGRLPADLRRTP